LLAEEQYVLPLLTVLNERGGAAPANEVIKAVGERLRDRFTPTDMDSLPSGAIRWQKRVQFVRLQLIEEGLLTKDSPRGVWALTPAGTKRAAEVQS